MTTSTQQLREIFETQVALLHGRSKQFELDAEEITKLGALTRAWKTFNSTEVKKPSDEDKFEEMSIDQLLELARSD